ncbi:MAG: hypothetical protein WC862_05525 [Patescibacteria group bacterium]
MTPRDFRGPTLEEMGIQPEEGQENAYESFKRELLAQGRWDYGEENKRREEIAKRIGATGSLWEQSQQIDREVDNQLNRMAQKIEHYLDGSTNPKEFDDRMEEIIEIIRDERFKNDDESAGGFIPRLLTRLLRQKKFMKK